MDESSLCGSGAGFEFVWSCLGEEPEATAEISNGNRTEWSAIQGVIGRVIAWFEISSLITPELHDTKSYYHLIK